MKVFMYTVCKNQVIVAIAFITQLMLATDYSPLRDASHFLFDWVLIIFVEHGFSRVS